MNGQQPGPAAGASEPAPGPAQGPVSAWRSRSRLGFVLAFAASLLAGNFILALPKVEAGFIEPWTRANTAAAASLTRLLGFEARASGSNLSCRGAELSVKNGCDGVHAMLILASAIVAFPGAWSRRLLGLVLGAIVIFGFNIIRLVNLLLVAAYFPARLEFFHVYVWQILIGLLALGTFLVWGTFLAVRR